MPKKKILCVDDNASMLRTLSNILSRHFEVFSALSAKEALGLFREHGPFPVVLSDARMPEQSGLELLNELKVKDPCMVGMILTADAVNDDTSQAVEDGEIFCSLLKPLKIPELLEQVNLAFEKHEELAPNCHCRFSYVE